MGEQVPSAFALIQSFSQFFSGLDCTTQLPAATEGHTASVQDCTFKNKVADTLATLSQDRSLGEVVFERPPEEVMSDLQQDMVS
ncbi:hypothetical protein V6N11_084135 [Hibiscus sabdariffa]|uniref:Uncharacterized protein n=1 Tax=Hibiscus sabdariffa TaxID=183260 RepID=A0ABR2QDH5_9ROSI